MVLHGFDVLLHDEREQDMYERLSASDARVPCSLDVCFNRSVWDDRLDL